MAHSPSSADADLHRGSGEADSGALPPLERPGWYERGIAGQEVEGDLGSGTGGPSRERVTEFVQQGENRDEPGQPGSEPCSIGHDHDDQEHVETGTDVHGEPEQPKRRL